MVARRVVARRAVGREVAALVAAADSVVPAEDSAAGDLAVGVSAAEALGVGEGTGREAAPE